MSRALALLVAMAATPVLATDLEIDVAGEANGTVVIRLSDAAPNHAARLVELARADAYDGVAFHRVIDGFMAQTGDVQFGGPGGDPAMAGSGGSDLPDLAAEFSDQPYGRGIVGMARTSDPNSANSQFFIMVADGPVEGRWPQLDGQYTIVGEVVSGMEVVDAIKRGDPNSGAVAGEPDRIVDVRVID